MKKYALVALFAVAVFGAAFAVSPQTGTLTIQGSVAEIFSLTLPGAYMSGEIANGSDAETWAIGDVTVDSNVKNWTISLSSKNGGYLVNTVDGTEKISYKVTLGALASAQALTAKWTSDSQVRTSKGGNTYGLSISFGPSDSYYQAGTYGDTLTLEIVHG